jgi:hypothetical protein
VTAETFRHTIERQIATSPKDPGLDRYVADIVGAKAFYAGRTAHVAGLSVRGNRLLITLVKPAGDLPTRVAMPEFCPVPLSVPVRGGGDDPIASAGPTTSPRAWAPGASSCRTRTTTARACDAPRASSCRRTCPRRRPFPWPTTAGST